MWVVEVGQLCQQLGDVIAGIQGRQIAAESANNARIIQAAGIKPE